MNADLIVQPIDAIRAAVETLAAGLSGGEVFSPEHWDRSVATLARCHDQVGGDTRRHLYAIFAASAKRETEGCVAAQLESLARRLLESKASPQSCLATTGGRAKLEVTQSLRAIGS